MVNVRSMHVVKSCDKSKQIVASVIRSTSCTRGWLRLVVQVIFGIIIVSSFILIVYMTICPTYMNQKRPRSRCMVTSCRVVCNDAPNNGKFEDHIIHAVGDTEATCGRVFLTLNRPMFINSSLPSHWLSAIRINVSDVEIIGGNLQHIPSDAFMSQFGGNIRVLVLVRVTINTLSAETFLGLSTLQELYIRDSVITNIRQNALQAIDNTLKTLEIKATNFWDPMNVTGSTNFEQLRIVDFSFNFFHDILGRNSFTELEQCRVLYLNWCKITAIGAGAFDNLKSIEILHLNNNYLVSLPSDIFDKIIPLEPRISLQENSWHCSCFTHNLRMLHKLGLLIVDPTCQHPASHRGLTFSEFEAYCEDDSITKILNGELYIFIEKSNTTAYAEQCGTNYSYEYHVNIRFPLPQYKCLSSRIFTEDLNTNSNDFSSDNSWLSPTFSVDTNRYSMVALALSGSYDYGLMWYKTSCPEEANCMNHLPKTLRVFNVDSSTQYTFCRVSFNSHAIIKNNNNCVAYDLTSLPRTSVFFYKSVLLFVCIAIICLLSGAICVYALIHKNPILLKGNKRVVFVKHKTVDALILPPKIPLRCNFLGSNAAEGNTSKIYFIPGNDKTSVSSNLFRSHSVRTTDSNDPSYISALQPSEDQLAEWRITRHLEVKCSYDSLDSNLSTISQKYTTNSLPYYSIDNTEKIYDTIKF